MRQCRDVREYEALRHSWDNMQRPEYSRKKWGLKQQEALTFIRDGYSHEDEDSRSNNRRSLYIDGEPGSGKSALLLEAAIRACTSVSVLIVAFTTF